MIMEELKKKLFFMVMAGGSSPAPDPPSPPTDVYEYRIELSSDELWFDEDGGSQSVDVYGVTYKNGTEESRSVISGYTIGEYDDTYSMFSASGTSGSVSVDAYSNDDKSMRSCRYVISKDGYTSATLYCYIEASTDVDDYVTNQYNVYRVSISSDSYDSSSSPCPASGGTASLYPSAEYKTVYEWASGDVTESSWINTSEYSISGSAEGFDISGTTVTIESRGTEYSESGRSCTYTIDCHGETDSVTLYQAENGKVHTYDSLSVSLQNYAPVEADGGTAEASGSWSQREVVSYDSGDTETYQLGGSLDDSAVDVSYSGSASGMSVDASTGEVSWDSNTSTDGRSAVITVTVHSNGQTATASAMTTQAGAEIVEPQERTLTAYYDTDGTIMNGIMTIDSTGSDFEFIEQDTLDGEEYIKWKGSLNRVEVSITNVSANKVRYTASTTNGSTSGSSYVCSPSDGGDDTWVFYYYPNSEGDCGLYINEETL